MLVIRNVTLIDGTGAKPLDSARIVIEGGRIASAGPADAEQAPEGAQVINGSGLWAVPGLIDAHVHLELVGREALPVWLALGVTTIRDLGGPVEFVAESRRQLDDGLSGPRLLFTGPMVDGDPPTWPALQPNRDAASAVAAVKERLNAGVDAVKLYTQLPPESLRRCIEEVDGRVPVTGHLSVTLASEAIDAGINGLEHALLTPYNDFAPEELRTPPGEVMMTPGFWQKVYEGWLRADFDSSASGRWIERLASSGTWLCPTLTVLPGAGQEPDADELRIVPGAADRWEARKLLRAAAPASPPEAVERALAARRRVQELVRRAHQAGGWIVAGTDTNAVGYLSPGFGLHQELALLSEAGLSNMDVLRAATARAAEALWRDDLGTIEAGKRADVLLVRGDPLADIGALRDIQLVVKDGVAYGPAVLLGQTDKPQIDTDGHG